MIRKVSIASNQRELQSHIIHHRQKFPFIQKIAHLSANSLIVGLTATHWRVDNRCVLLILPEALEKKRFKPQINTNSDAYFAEPGVDATVQEQSSKEWR